MFLADSIFPSPIGGGLPPPLFPSHSLGAGDVTLASDGFFCGTHVVAVEFAEDYWNRYAGADGDRNLYLDGLQVIRQTRNDHGP